MKRAAGNLFRPIRRVIAEALALAASRSSWIERALVSVGTRAAARSELAEGLYRTVRQLLSSRWKDSDRRYREVGIRGHAMVVDVSDATGHQPFFLATLYEPAVTDALLNGLTRGDVFIDVGANIGYFSVLAARVVGPDGRVIAFEPHEGARAALADLARRNGVAPIVEIVPLAVSDREETLPLYAAADLSSYTTLNPLESPMREVTTFQPAGLVRTVTLDTWLAARPEIARRVRCIKVDVEGHEGAVLRGMTGALTSPSVMVICETTIGSEADEALRAAGFHRQRIEDPRAAYGNFLYVRPAVSAAR